jgi:hypothetical protein
MSEEDKFKKEFKSKTDKAVKKDSKKLYPVSDKDIKAMRDQEENGTNSYSKINQSIIKSFAEDKEMQKDLLPPSDKDIEKIQEKMNKIGRKPPKEETLIDI